MSRPNKSEEEKYSCPVRAYVKPGTYGKLLKYCKDMKYPTVSFAARRIIESLDTYTDRSSLMPMIDAIEPRPPGGNFRRLSSHE